MRHSIPLDITAERRTPDGERRTENAERRMQNAERERAGRL